MRNRSARIHHALLGAAIFSALLLNVATAWAQPSPFACTGEAFIVQDQNAQLTQVDQTVSPFVFVNIGGPAGIEYNNLAFRRSDGFLYAVQLRTTPTNGNDGIITVDSTGTPSAPMAVTGLPTTVRYDAGDISTDGTTMYIHQGNATNVTLQVVNLATLTATGVTVTGATGNVNDWAYNPVDGLLYGGDRVGAAGAGQLARLNPTTGVRTDFAVAGCAPVTATCSAAALPTGTAFGGAWFNAAGSLFIYQNGGEIFEIDLGPLAAPTPQIISTQTGPSSGFNDGAACVQDVIGAAKQFNGSENPATITALPAAVTIDYTFENFTVGLALNALTVTEDLTAVFGVRGVDWTFTSITSAPLAFANPGFNGDTDQELINQAPQQSLAAGASATVTVTIQLLTDAAAVAGEYVNQIQVLGTDATGLQFGDLSTDGVNPDPNSDGAPDERVPSVLPIGLVPQPGLTVAKSSTTTQVTAAGQVVPYTYVVTNTGAVPLTNVTLADNNTDAVPVCVPAQPAALAVAAVMNCTAQHTVTLAEMNAGGNLTNTATADSDETGPAQDTLDIPIVQTPALTVAKSSTTTQVTSAGQVVPYTYVVTNTGNVTLTGVTLADNNTDATPVCVPAQPATLAPAGVMNCTAQHTVTLAEMNAGGNLTNTATADSNETGPAQDTLNIPIVQTPALTVAKSSTTTQVTASGQVVPYTYVVTNTGNVTLTGVTLADNNTDATPVCVPAQPATLAPAAVMNCTAQHTVTQPEMDAGGNLTNTATADSNETGPAQDTLDIPIVQTPALTVAKSSTTTQVTASGQVVPYTYVVTNTGNVTLTGVTLADNNTDATPVCVPAQPATLAPAAVMNCTAQHTVTLAEMNAGGNLTNTATADSNETGPAQDTLNIPIVPGPALTVAKSSTTTQVTASGQVVPYTYVVTNTGTVTLTGVTLADNNTDATPVCVPAQPATLAPAAVMNCTAQHTVTLAEMNAGGNLTNTATADSNETGPAQDTLNIPIVQTPELSLVKTATPPTFSSVGQVISYSYLVSNPGNVTLTGLTVADDNDDDPPGVSCPVTTLAPGASTTCTSQRTVTQADINAGSITNTAVATGTSPGAMPVQSPPDSETVTAAAGPALTLVKTGTLDVGADGVATPGDLITYTFEITNIGNVALSNVSVTDPMVSPITCPGGNPIPSLAVAAMVTCTGTYAITQADIDAGQKDNTATASGQDPTGAPVTDTDTETVPITQVPAIDLVKNGTLNLGPNGVVNVGDLIGYTFTVTNSGNVLLTNITVSDPIVSPVTCPGGNPIPSLAVGASVVCTGSYALTQADIDAGERSNMATATGTGLGTVVTDDDTHVQRLVGVIIPTLSEWSLALFAFLLLAGSLRLLRRLRTERS